MERKDILSVISSYFTPACYCATTCTNRAINTALYNCKIFIRNAISSNKLSGSALHKYPHSIAMLKLKMVDIVDIFAMPNLDRLDIDFDEKNLVLTKDKINNSEWVNLNPDHFPKLQTLVLRNISSAQFHCALPATLTKFVAVNSALPTLFHKLPPLRSLKIYGGYPQPDWTKVTTITSLEILCWNELVICNLSDMPNLRSIDVLNIMNIGYMPSIQYLSIGAGRIHNDISNCPNLREYFVYGKYIDDRLKPIPELHIWIDDLSQISRLYSFERLQTVHLHTELDTSNVMELCKPLKCQVFINGVKN